MKTLIPNSLLFNKITKKSKEETLCLDEILNFKINYKNLTLLKNYISEQGKIVPAKISGASSRQQKILRNAIQRARYISLLPYTIL